MTFPHWVWEIHIWFFLKFQEKFDFLCLVWLFPEILQQYWLTLMISLLYSQVEVFCESAQIGSQNEPTATTLFLTWYQTRNNLKSMSQIYEGDCVLARLLSRRASSRYPIIKLISQSILRSLSRLLPAHPYLCIQIVFECISNNCNWIKYIAESSLAETHTRILWSIE